MEQTKKAIYFLNQLQMLKNTSRTGWLTILAPDESVAEHTYRTAMIGLLIAKMLNLKKEQQLEVVVGCLLHDIEECYIGDLHKIAQNYLKTDKRKLQKKLLDELPKELKEDYKKFLNPKNKENKKIKEIIMDADRLECALTAKYYLDLGYKTEDWIKNSSALLNTDIAKNLLEEINRIKTIEWIKENKKADKKG
ncbi:MAG: HD domain-containing protein [Candidatus Anstonellaceae archaeon]